MSTMIGDISAMRLKDSISVIDRTTLKLIAITAMLIDHMGAILYPEIKFLRWIGRIAFPIFVYQLVEGYKNTSNIRKYFNRLLLFAFISEIPFDLAFYSVPFYWEHQNVYFELVLCLLALVLLDKTKEMLIVVRCEIIFLICFASIFLRTDYNAYGIILAVLFYLFENNFILQVFGMVVLTCVFSSHEQLFCLFSLPLIIMYKNKLSTQKLSKVIQFAFYAFYPLHIILIYIIKQFCK